MSYSSDITVETRNAIRTYGERHIKELLLRNVFGDEASEHVKIGLTPHLSLDFSVRTMRGGEIQVYYYLKSDLTLLSKGLEDKRVIMNVPANFFDTWNEAK